MSTTTSQRSGGDAVDLGILGLPDALLVTGVGGVQEKLAVARLTNDFSTLGADLVASTLNSVLGSGATPLFFSYRLAGGALDLEAVDVVKTGIQEACDKADCKLIVGNSTVALLSGGEDNCELAGFAVAVGTVQRCQSTAASAQDGDVVLGVTGGGVDGVVVTLARKVMEQNGLRLSEPATFSASGKTIGAELLSPATILPGALRQSVASGVAKVLVPLTAASLQVNVEAALASHLAVQLDAAKWPLPALLGWLMKQGCSEDDLVSGSNLGLAALLVVAKDSVDAVQTTLKSQGSTSYVVGSVVKATADTPRVTVSNVRATPPPPEQSQKRRVAVLVSECGKNLRALIEATRDPRRRTNAEVVLVVSNVPGVEALEVAERAGVPTKTIPHRGFPSRVAFDMAVHDVLLSSGVELICLARFVRILSGEFTRLWRGRVINLHPAILPLFKGIHVQKQALDAGVRLTGCSVHFVEEDVDAGAIIIQEPLPIEPSDTVDSLLERMKRLEVRIYPRALALVATGRVAVGLDGRIVWNF